MSQEEKESTRSDTGRKRLHEKSQNDEDSSCEASAKLTEINDKLDKILQTLGEMKERLSVLEQENKKLKI